MNPKISLIVRCAGCGDARGIIVTVPGRGRGWVLPSHRSGDVGDNVPTRHLVDDEISAQKLGNEVAAWLDDEYKVLDADGHQIAAGKLDDEFDLAPCRCSRSYKPVTREWLAEQQRHAKNAEVRVLP